MFQEVSASDRRPDEVYLDEVERYDIHVGLFGRDYGSWTRQAFRPPSESSTALRTWRITDSYP